MREMFGRMYTPENGEEVAVESCGIGHTRIAEKDRKDRGQRDPQYHPGDEVRGTRAIETLDENAGDERGVLRFAPRHHTEQAGLHGEIQKSDAKNRKKNAARDVFFRLADFAAQLADVVVAPVAVNGVDHRGAETREPQ